MSGHASHRGTSDKPNVNAEGVLSEAADKTIDPQDELLEGATTNTTRSQEFVDYPPALERPEASSEGEKASK